MTLDSGKIYADIRGGSQDLCKFSLDFIPASIITYTGMACRSRFQVQVFSLTNLFIQLAYIFCEKVLDVSTRPTLRAVNTCKCRRESLDNVYTLYTK